jgi:osmotically-inducible protein OsmY
MSGTRDSELFGEVRRALGKDRRVKSADLIQLSVENGVVQLWGNVESAAEKAAAEEVARSQSGVKDVVNALTVVMATPALDEQKELAEAVEKALVEGHRVRPRDIGVASVEHGVVRLVGHAGSVAEERAAVAAVAAVPGVRDVVSEVTIGEVEPEEAIEIFDDAAIKGMVNSAISERGVTIYDEDTLVDGGVVYLRGRVANEQESRVAEQAAAAVAGVRDTVNQLVLDHALESRNPDEALAARVTQALQRDRRVSPAQVHVQSVRGDVHLFGYVDSIDDQNAAIAIAKSVPGVRRVFSDIVIMDRTTFGTGQREVGAEREEAE